MVQAEVTLEQFIKFLDDWKPIKFRCLQDIVGVLEESLDKAVFTTHDDTVHIQSKADLQRYIKSGGRSHFPPRTPVKGNAYSPKYLELKNRLGEHKPHKFQEYGFYHGIEVKTIYDSVIMKAEMPETAEDKDFDYLTHHERRRSVLKLAFLRGWSRIVEAIIKRLKKEAKA